MIWTYCLAMNLHVKYEKHKFTLKVGDFCKFIYTSVSVDPPNKIWSQNFKVSVVRIEPLTFGSRDERATKLLRRWHKR